MRLPLAERVVLTCFLIPRAPPVLANKCCMVHGHSEHCPRGVDVPLAPTPDLIKVGVAVRLNIACRYVFVLKVCKCPQEDGQTSIIVLGAKTTKFVSEYLFFVEDVLNGVVLGEGAWGSSCYGGSTRSFAMMGSRTLPTGSATRGRFIATAAREAESRRPLLFNWAGMSSNARILPSPQWFP